MKIIKYLYILFCLVYAECAFAQQPFTAGNIVVYRVGNGVATVGSSAAPVYLDEYAPDGTLVQSIAMPVAISGSNNILTTRGSQLSEGQLSLSADGKYLVLAGMNTAPGAGSSGTATVIGLVDFNGKVNTSTAITDFTENPSNRTRAAVSDDGNRIWFGGSSVIRYAIKGSSTSVLINNGSNQVFNLNVASGQLYIGTDNAAVVSKVGTGLPVTSGQTITSLPGLPADIQPGGQFAFADLNPNIPGADVLYAASPNSTINPSVGIRKFSLVNGNWVDNGSIGGEVANSWYAGLAVQISGNAVTIFASRGGANSVKGGELVKLTDNSGYNSTITGNPTVIASVTTANTKAFRGIALVPQPAPFTAGDIAVYRVGDGVATVGSSAAPVYLDEYAPDGTLVQSIAMPVTASGGNNILTTRGSQLSEGQLSISADGKYLLLGGMNTAPGAGSSGTATVIGVIDFNGKVNTSTAITDFTENPSNRTRAVVSDDGNNIWFGGSSVIRYATKGSTNSVLVNNGSNQVFNLNITGAQLYMGTDASSVVSKVGTGLPVTSGQIITSLPGLPADIQPGGQFAFADLNPNIPGVDVLYVASPNSTISPAVGIRKFSLVNGNWVDNGSIGGQVANSWYAGLAVRVLGNVVTIFATRGGANSIKGGELVKLTDNSGYNGTITGTPAVIAAVATTNTKAFRGVALVPLGCPSVSDIQITNITPTQATLAWHGGTAGTNYEYAITTSATPPASGTVTGNTSFTATGLTDGVAYYAHIRTVCSAQQTSDWNTKSFLTTCSAPESGLIDVQVSNTGAVTVKWNKVFGAQGYEYYVSTVSTSPVSGTALNDTTVVITGLNTVSQYYIYVRSNCGNGSFSTWTSKPFTTSCFMPAITMSVDHNNASVTWNNVSNAVKYEYALTYSPAKPVSGTFTTDTSYSMNKLNDKVPYYFHVRAYCNKGSVSEWATLPFNVQGMSAYPNPVMDILKININGIANPDGEMMISDVMGRMIGRMRITGNSITIDTKGLAAGIYIIRYTNDSQKYILRVVKQ